MSISSENSKNQRNKKFKYKMPIDEKNMYQINQNLNLIIGSRENHFTLKRGGHLELKGSFAIKILTKCIL